MPRISRQAPQETVRADWWEPGETVTLKTRPAGYDLHYIDSAARQFTQRGADIGSDKVDITLAYHETALATLECAVLSWTFTYEDGKPIPAIRTTFKQLDKQDMDYLLAEVDRLWEEYIPKLAASEAEQRKANFRGSEADTGSVEGATESEGPA
jgi:hypothetical protein